MIKKVIFKYLIYFSILLIFFTVVCPIVPYEGDDWYFIGAMRQPIPYFNIFNPSKILPEVLEPLCGYFGAYLIYPFTHDYVGSLSISASVFISGFIVLMLYLFNSVLTKRFKVNDKMAFVYELLFFILFFVIFKREDAHSYYGFWSKSFNCYFNYTFLGIINACVVLYMMQYDNFLNKFNESSNLFKGIFITIIYLTIFSSIQFNIMISSYAFVMLVDEFVKNLKKKGKFNFLNFIKKLFIYIFILVLWCISLIFDFSGLRGKMVSSSNWLTFDNFKLTIDSLISLYKLIFKPLIIVLIINIALIIYKAIKTKKYDSFIEILKVFGLFIINTVYLIILYMNAGYGYAARVDATWAILFYLLLFIMMSIIICNNYFKITEVFVPIMVIIFALVSINMNYPYAQSVFDAKAAKKVDNYIINQIIKADSEGKCCVEVIVPQGYDSETNWPIPYNMATWLQNTLYSHGIIRSRMYIKFIPDQSVNDKLLNKDYSSMHFFDFERSKEL